MNKVKSEVIREKSGMVDLGHVVAKIKCKFTGYIARHYVEYLIISLDLCFYQKISLKVQ